MPPGFRVRRTGARSRRHLFARDGVPPPAHAGGAPARGRANVPALWQVSHIPEKIPGIFVYTA